MTAINRSEAALSAAVLGARAVALLDELALFTDEEGRLTRLYLSPAHRAAAEHVRSLMQAMGLKAVIDAAGSVQGRLEGREPGLPAVMIASHIDTVRDGGRYDGNLGVVAGLLVAEALREEARHLPFAIEVVAFGDEENVRFPTNLSTARALTGHYDPAWLEACDSEGISLRQALLAFGGDPGGIDALRRAPGSVLAYLEVHIEQGPVLEAQGEALGIVTAINAQMRARVRVCGQAGHAGTVPMRLRKDALAAAAEMVLAVEAVAAGHTDAVGTVGLLKPEPGAANVIPGEARFSVDLRAPRDETVGAMEAALRERWGEIAMRRGVTWSFEPHARTQATAMDGALQEALARGAARAGLNRSPLRLASGAGHDAMAMTALCPAAMLFVRHEKGISHSPLEAMTADDAGVAIRALIETVRELAERHRER